MILFSFALLIATAFSTLASAQQSAWGQCGGQNWTGPTTCVPGYHCLYFHAWYSQCVPECGTSTVYSASTAVTTVTYAVPTVITYRPSASYSTGSRTVCASTGYDGVCATSTVTKWTAIFEWFGGRVTTTYTGQRPVTSVASIPVATTTVPCYKREVPEKREVVDAQ